MWKKVGGMIALFTLPLGAQNTLSVTNTSALEGNYGLEINLDGTSSDKAYVETNAPNNETHVKVRFMLRAENATNIKDDSSLRILYFARDVAPAVFLVGFLRHDLENDGDRTYRFNVWARQNSGNFTFVGGVWLSFDNSPKTHQLEVEWRAGNGDGFVCVRRLTPSYKEVCKNNLATSAFDIDYFRFGLVQNPAAQVNGAVTYYLDEFEAYRMP